MKNVIEKRIILYTNFIKDGKVSPLSGYSRDIVKLKEILTLLNNNKMTPEIFDKFDSRNKWDIAGLLKNVEWCCNKCGLEQGNETPKSMFMGERCCSNCDNLLTERTNGGQSNPFNYTFKNK